MGNAQLKVGGDSNDLLITTSLLQNFKKHVTSVDHAVTGLVRGIDALQSTCKLFLQQKEKNTAEEHKGTMASEETEVLIIQKMHECISDNREISIESLRNLFSFLKDNGQTYIANADDAFASLSVNKYKQCHSDDMTPRDWFTEFYKRRLEQLKADIELLQKSNELQKKEIENLKKKSSLFMVKDTLARALKDWPDPTNMHDKMLSVCELESINDALLKTSVKPSCTHVKPTQNLKPDQSADDENQVKEYSDDSTARNESAAIRDTNETVCEQTIHDLRKQITSLEHEKSMMVTELLTKEQTINRLSKRKLLVQVFSRYVTSSPKDPEEDLLVLLGTEFSKRDLELKVLCCKRPGQVVSGCPLLVTIDHSYYSRRKNTTIESAMAGLEFTQDKAVIVFHFTPEKDLPNELKLYDKKYTSLGGVIHFGHNTSLYTSTLNTNSIKEVIAFIEKLGKVVIESSF